MGVRVENLRISNTADVCRDGPNWVIRPMAVVAGLRVVNFTVDRDVERSEEFTEWYDRDIKSHRVLVTPPPSSYQDLRPGQFAHRILKNPEVLAVALNGEVMLGQGRDDIAGALALYAAQLAHTLGFPSPEILWGENRSPTAYRAVTMIRGHEIAVAVIHPGTPVAKCLQRTLRRALDTVYGEYHGKPYTTPLGQGMVAKEESHG